jgi:2-hydroxy-6-oxonona-2,4-dienedioate hydrolase
MSSIWTDLTPLPFQFSYVDAGGVPTRALIAGDGPDVVCLHGTSGHLEAFTRNVKAHVVSGYRIHAIDLLGHGYTGKPDEPYEIPRYVEHVLAYLDAQGIERAHLVGESLGGWIGAFLATDHPERVASLQLVCAGGTKASPAVMDRIKRSTTEAVLRDDMELTRRRLDLLMANPERDVTDELVRVRYDIYHRGRENPFGEVPEAQMMHESIPASELVLLDDCGHWPQHEQTERYHRAALPFLAKATG